MKLVVIEAPAKRKTIKKYLGQGYEVFATKGHIRDLPVKSFAIDMNNHYEPHYENKPDKKELISELKNKANKAEEVLIATDPDREGEAMRMFWDLTLTQNAELNLTKFLKMPF